jgi:purine-nucleoside phosphorylase
MADFISYAEIDAASDYIKVQIQKLPEIGLILGSGLGGLANSIEDPLVISTKEVPNWPISTVPGHEGKLVFGKLDGKVVMALQGRVHYYEGHPISKIGLPIRVMQRLGVKTLILTNAAGGLNPDFQAGDVMVMRDHIAFMQMGGENPLRGPNLDEFGPRFPDMSQVYDLELADLAVAAAKKAGINVREGVYVWLAGPSFESPAECRFLRAAGADAVGMSTVPEAIVAKHGGMRILGLSGITNKIDVSGKNAATHEEVLGAGVSLAPKMTTIIHGVLKAI